MSKETVEIFQCDHVNEDGVRCRTTWPVNKCDWGGSCRVCGKDYCIHHTAIVRFWVQTPKLPEPDLETEDGHMIDNLCEECGCLLDAMFHKDWSSLSRAVEEILIELVREYRDKKSNAVD